jgi:hypothetical protein
MAFLATLSFCGQLHDMPIQRPDVIEDQEKKQGLPRQQYDLVFCSFLILSHNSIQSPQKSTEQAEVM